MRGGNCLGQPFVDRYMFKLSGDGKHANGKFPKLVIIGKTKHVSMCQNCGRDGLQHTIVCARLGDDGHPTDEHFYFGTDCASKIAGKPEKEVDAEAESKKPVEQAGAKDADGKKKTDAGLALRFQAAITASQVERFAAVDRRDLSFKDVTKRIPELTEFTNDNLVVSPQGKPQSVDNLPERNLLIDELKPVHPFEKSPSPTTDAQALSALRDNQKPKWNAELSPNDRIALRLDIPAYSSHGVWVPTIHSPQGKVISHLPAVHIHSASFNVKPQNALLVAAGGPKNVHATIEGNYVGTSPDEVYRKVSGILRSGKSDWQQIGYDPERHSYFYPRNNHRNAVVSAQEVMQVGPLVLAKRPVMHAFDDSHGSAAVLYSAVKDALVERYTAESLNSRRWYLKSVNLLNQKMGNSAPADQVLSMLRNNNIHPEELEWTGLEKHLASRGNKPVTKQELIDLASQMEIKEVHGRQKQAVLSPEDLVRLDYLQKLNEKHPLGAIEDIEPGSWEDLLRLENIHEKSTTGSLKNTFEYFTREAQRAQRTGNARKAKTLFDKANHVMARWEALDLQGHGLANDTKYSEYTLPGGDNYQEMLLTLPVKPAASVRQTTPDAAAYEKYKDQWEQAKSEWERVKNTPGSERDYHEQAMDHIHHLMASDTFSRRVKHPLEGARQFYHAHWNDTPNVLAHVRWNDRIGPDGKKHLHIEEIQSDWHQDGRKHGYEEPPNIEIQPRKRNGKDVFTVVINGRDGLSYETKEQAERFANSQPIAPGLVPNAPFKNNWRMLAMKRVIDHAVRNGYDRVTWTPGQEQADRYPGLQENVKQVSTVKQPDGRYLTYLETPNGRYTSTKHGFSENGQGTFTHEQLAELFGHHTAQHLVQGADAKALKRAQLRPDERSRFEEWHDLYPSAATGHPNGLKIGGHKMRKAYDEILPQETSRLIKKHGGVVTQFPISIPQYTTPSKTPSKYKTVMTHGFDITPQMKGMVLGQGQSLFSAEEDASHVVERYAGDARNQQGFQSFRLGAGLQKLSAPQAPKPPRNPAFKIADAIRAAVHKARGIKPVEEEQKEAFGVGQRVADVLVERFASPYTFRSGKLIAEKAQDNQLASQVLAMLRNNQVSQDELKWTGLEKKLSEMGNQKVNRQELQDMLGRIGLREEMLSDDPKETWNSTGGGPSYRGFITPGDRTNRQINYRELLLHWDPEHVRSNPYKEWNDLPEGVEPVQVSRDGTHEVRLPIGELLHPNWRRDDFVVHGMSAEEARQNAIEKWNDHVDELQKHLRPEGYEPFSESHHGRDNILAHVRMTDRTTANHDYRDIDHARRNRELTPEENESLGVYGVATGHFIPSSFSGRKPKTLHIEEIQSDWHNKIRESGVRTGKENDEENAVYRQMDQMPDVDDSKTNRIYADLAYQLHKIARKRIHGQPDAPMQSTLTPAVLRKLIHYAVSKGYDRVTWAPGWEQARRYPMEDTATHINYEPAAFIYPNTARWVKGHKITLQNGRRKIAVAEGLVDYHVGRKGASSGMSHAELSQAFGQDVADAIHAGKGQQIKHGVGGYTGVREFMRLKLPQPIRIGPAAGLRPLYDKEMPKHAAKVIKPFGGNIKQFHLLHRDYHYPGRFEAKRQGKTWSVIDNATGQVHVDPQHGVRSGLDKRNAEYTAGVHNRQMQSSPVLGFDITPAMKAHYEKEGPQLFAVEVSSDWSGERYGWIAPQIAWNTPEPPAKQTKRLTTGERVAQSLLGKRASGVSMREAIIPQPLQKRFVSFIGRSLGSPDKHEESLAKLAQRYRDPRYETFRAIYLQGNKVVGVNAISSRHPSLVYIGHHYNSVYDTAHKLNADAVWLVHNHPSGNAKPSENDHGLTRYWSNKFEDYNQQLKNQGVAHQVKLAGHIVTNHDHYTFHGPSDDFGSHKTVQLPKAGKVLFKKYQPHEAGSLLGHQISGPDDLASLGWSLHKNPNQGVVVLADVKHKVRGLLDVDASHLTHKDPTRAIRTLGAIRRMHRNMGTNTAFLLMPPGMKHYHINSSIRAHGAFLDMVEHPNTTTVASTIGQNPLDLMGVYGMAKHPFTRPRAIKAETAGQRFAAYWEASVERFAARKKQEKRWKLRTVEALQKMPEFAPASQIWGTLVNQGISPEELKWTGMEHYLKPQGNSVVSRDELIDRASRLRVREQMAEPNVLGFDFTDYMYDNGSDPFEYIFQIHPDYRSAIGIPHKVHFPNKHWEHDNVIAHMRGQDMMGVDGKRNLHLEELQSDWHQAGRDHGYNDAPPPSKKEIADYFNKNRKKFEDELPWPLTNETWDDLESGYQRDLKQPIITAMRGELIPSAPFANNWHMLLMKRAIQHAAENGHDRISWPVGSEHSKRYSLGRKFDSLAYHPETQELHYRQITPAGNVSGWKKIKSKVAPEKLPSYIGRGLSAKLLGTQPQPVDLHDRNAPRPAFGQHLKQAHILSGQDLHDDHGMGWYDTAVVNHTNNLLKKLGGGRVYRSKVDAGQDGHRDVHAFDVTPEMKAKVSGGVSLFSLVSDDDLGLERFAVEGGPERYFVGGLFRATDPQGQPSLKSWVGQQAGNIKKAADTANQFFREKDKQGNPLGFQGWANKKAEKIGNFAGAVNRLGQKIHSQIDSHISGLDPQSRAGKEISHLDQNYGGLFGQKPNSPLPYKPISGVRAGTSVWLNKEHVMGKSGAIIPHMTRGRLVRETSDTHAHVELEDGRHFQLPKANLYYAIDPKQVADAKSKVIQRVKDGAQFIRQAPGRLKTAASELRNSFSNAFGRKEPNLPDMQPVPEPSQQEDPYTHGPIHSHNLKPGDLIHQNINGEHHITRVDQLEDEGRKITGTRMRLSQQHPSGVVEHGSKVNLKGWENLPDGAGSAARTFHVSRQKNETPENKDHDPELARKWIELGVSPEQAIDLARDDFKKNNVTPAAPESTPSPATVSSSTDAIGERKPPASSSGPAPAKAKALPSGRQLTGQAQDKNDQLNRARQSHSKVRPDRVGIHDIPPQEFAIGSDPEAHGVFVRHKQTGKVSLRFDGKLYDVPETMLKDGRPADPKKFRATLHQELARQQFMKAGIKGLSPESRDFYEKRIDDKWSKERAAAGQDREYAEMDARRQKNIDEQRRSNAESPRPAPPRPEPSAARKAAMIKRGQLDREDRLRKFNNFDSPAGSPSAPSPEGQSSGTPSESDPGSSPGPVAGQSPESEAKPDWQIMDINGQLHRVNMNEKNLGERARTRQPVGTDERVLATHDQHGQPIASEVLQHRQDFMDKAQPGAEFTSNAYPDARFSVLDDGKILDVTTGRIMTNVPAMANGLDPRPFSKGGKNHQVTWTKTGDSTEKQASGTPEPVPGQPSPPSGSPPGSQAFRIQTNVKKALAEARASDAGGARQLEHAILREFPTEKPEILQLLKNHVLEHHKGKREESAKLQDAWKRARASMGMNVDMRSRQGRAISDYTRDGGDLASMRGSLGIGQKYDTVAAQLRQDFPRLFSKNPQERDMQVMQFLSSPMPKILRPHDPEHVESLFTETHPGYREWLEKMNAGEVPFEPFDLSPHKWNEGLDFNDWDTQADMFWLKASQSLTERFSLALAQGKNQDGKNPKAGRNKGFAGRGKLHDSIRKALVV